MPIQPRPCAETSSPCPSVRRSMLANVSASNWGNLSVPPIRFADGPLRGLAVLPTDVVNAAGRWPVADGAVWSPVVVVVEPVWQGGVAVAMGAVGEAVGPFACHRLVETLDLAVGAWPVRLSGEVTDAAAGEQLVQRAVPDVAEAVVGHQPLADDLVAFEEGERPPDEAGDRFGFLVVVELDVGEPRVVVDDRVREVVSDTRFRPHPAA